MPSGKQAVLDMVNSWTKDASTIYRDAMDVWIETEMTTAQSHGSSHTPLRVRFAVLLGAALVTLLAGCGDPASNPPSSSPPPSNPPPSVLTPPDPTRPDPTRPDPTPLGPALLDPTPPGPTTPETAQNGGLPPGTGQGPETGGS
ncbi:MAG: hypothetical protein ACRDTF_24160 [Pseudonocardiaceae bacterium]